MRKSKRRRVLYLIGALLASLLIGLLIFLFIGLPISERGHNEHSLFFDMRTRTYLLHLPEAYNNQKPLPLVIVLHGGGGNARNAIRLTGMSARADKEGFIVVYPNGTGRLKNRMLTWNAGNGDSYAAKNNVDDVGFIRTLIDNLQSKYKIDAKRIYVTGMSNGGMMAYRLGCELSDIAAIAPVAGSLNYEDCRPSHPVSVIAFHGTADKIVPYNGGLSKRRLFYLFRTERVDKPVSYAVSFWVKRNGCSTVPQTEESRNIIRETYTGGINGTEVILYTIKGGGHAWPGGPKVWRFGDEPTQEILATDTIWEIFSKHPKQ